MHDHHRTTSSPVPYGYNQSQLGKLNGDASISSDVPSRVCNSTAASGWGDPPNIVQSGGYYHFAAIESQPGWASGSRNMFFVTAELDRSVLVAHGEGIQFVPPVSPYTLPPGTEKDHLCVAANLPVCAPAGLAGHQPLSLFILTLACDEQSGLTLRHATSSDPHYLVGLISSLFLFSTT